MDAFVYSHVLVLAYRITGIYMDPLVYSHMLALGILSNIHNFHKTYIFMNSLILNIKVGQYGNHIEMSANCYID